MLDLKHDVAGTPNTALPILMALVIGGGVALFTRDLRYVLAVTGLYAAGTAAAWALFGGRRRS
jgi:hypothetical protein